MILKDLKIEEAIIRDQYCADGIYRFVILIIADVIIRRGRKYYAVKLKKYNSKAQKHYPRHYYKKNMDRFMVDAENIEKDFIVPDTNPIGLDGREVSLCREIEF